MNGSALATSLAQDVLISPDFIEPAIHLRQTEGVRNDDGIWVPGSALELALDLVSAPITGQERMTLPEGLRDEDVRRFWLQGDHPSLRYGVSDGDLLILGKLGATRNRFSGASQRNAEQARDAYADVNPAWLAGYRADSSLAVQLHGFGTPRYERFDGTDGHWAVADTWRAATANRWGPFTEVMGVRQDPGNEG